MASYRFCRPDDIPRLVHAVNECFVVHFPPSEPQTIESYRAEMKQISVWPSSCMVALSGDDPIAVLIGTKRSHETLVLRIGVRPDHLRQGHGLHLITSLSQKLAVLGPPRLAAEVPLDLPGVAPFFAAAGYEQEALYVDWIRAAIRATDATEPVLEELIIPLTVADADAAGLLDIPAGVAWERTRESLLGSQEVLEGLAIATPERIEACLLFRIGARMIDVVAARCVDTVREQLFLGMLLRYLAERHALPVRLPKLCEAELPVPVLEGAGFEAGRTFARVTVEAVSG